MTPEEKLHRLIAGGNKTQIIDFLIVNQNLFNILINTYIAGNYRIAQRLTPAVTELAIKKPAFLRPYWRKLLKAIRDPKASMTLKRNTIRMFQWVDIPPAFQLNVLDLCIKSLQDKSEAIAVKVFSMSVCELLTRGSEELRRELTIIIEDQLPYAGPAFRSRATKVLKLLKTTVNKSAMEIS